MLKRKMTWGTRATAFALGLLMTTAVAFFIGNYLSEDEHTGTTGSGGTGTVSLPMQVSFPSAALTPTNPVKITVKIDNPTGQTVMFHHLEMKVESEAPGCPASGFDIEATGTEAAFWNEALAGKTLNVRQLDPETTATPLIDPTESTDLWLALEDTGASQAACEEVPITVTGKLES